MWARVIGIAILVLGAALAALGINGAVHGTSLAVFSNSLADFAGVRGFDAAVWRLHWTLCSAAVGCIGSLIAIGGIAVSFRRRWGFLLLAAALVLSAVAPWFLQALGWVRYSFERANLTETVVLALLAFVAWLRSHVRTADSHS
jgi:hypothetical protein